jgi:hypothetical protein
VKVNVAWLAGEGTRPAHAGERAEVKAERLAAIDRIATIAQSLRQRAAETHEAIEGQGPKDRSGPAS